jgi:hypothetical protein
VGVSNCAAGGGCPGLEGVTGAMIGSTLVLF